MGIETASLEIAYTPEYVASISLGVKERKNKSFKNCFLKTWLIIKTWLIKENVLDSLELKFLDNFPCNNILLHLDGCKHPEMVNCTGEENNRAILLLSILRNPLISLLVFYCPSAGHF